MRSLSSTVLFATVLLLAGCGGAPVRESNSRDPSVEEARLATDAQLAEASEVTLWIEGMGCPMCATNLEYELEEIRGVVDASIDLKAGTASVVMGKESATREQLEKAVVDSGLMLARVEVTR